MERKIVVAVTGASGSVYAKVLLDKITALRSQWKEVSLIMSDNARFVWQHELDNTSYDTYTFRSFEKNDFTAPCASGSAGYDTMIVCPCSMGTLGRVAAGTSDDLITRAADVMLKERRKLVLVVREAPYSLIHINNMKALTEAGGIVCPATPSFYSRPQTVEQIAATVVDRVLQLAGFDVSTFRWGNH